MLLMGALLVLAQAAAESSPDGRDRDRDRPSSGGCVRIAVTSPQHAPGTRPRRAFFSATRILDLRIAGLMRRPAAGRHVLHFKVYTPRGHLYQTLTVPFTGPGRRPRERWVDGFPRPLAEESQRPVRDGGERRYEVSATLPVGGTAILSNSLYGHWRVEAYLDDDLRPCGPAARFEIQP